MDEAQREGLLNLLQVVAGQQIAFNNLCLAMIATHPHPEALREAFEMASRQIDDRFSALPAKASLLAEYDTAYNLIMKNLLGQER